MLLDIMDVKFHYLKHYLQINVKMTVNIVLINQKETLQDLN